MIMKRMKKPQIEVVDFLLNACHHSDDADLGVLLRLCVTDPNHYRVYYFEDNDEIVGSLLAKIYRPIFYIWLAGAKEFFTWFIDGIPFLDEEAKLLGCNKLKFYGRTGWIKKKLHGWKPSSVEFVREI